MSDDTQEAREPTGGSWTIHWLGQLRPRFWSYEDAATAPYQHSLNFRQVWKQAVLVTAVVALTPLVFMGVIEHKVSKRAATSQINLRMTRLVSNTRRSVTYFLEERKAAVDFIVHEVSFEQLSDRQRLGRILESLKTAFGGFTDLGVIDNVGNQLAYVGPFALEGVNYGNEDWYREVLGRGIYISDVFLGFRLVPHFVIAIRHQTPDGTPYVVRATIDTARFNELLAHLDDSGQGDAFLVNRDGVLQTPSRFYGSALEKLPLEVPPFSRQSEVVTYETGDRKSPMVIGYAYVKDTPLVLMICQHREDLIGQWRSTRLPILAFLAFSIAGIILVVVGVSTYLVQQIHEADQRRVAILHQVEYSNKMASIGRLAAGVAHEINNPLAIINEKAGLIKDLFAFTKSYSDDPKLLGLVDSILGSVERCARITRRLLGFARHVDGEPTTQIVDLKDLIREVIGFLENEASCRSINLKTVVAEGIPSLEVDRGKMQQILLNLLHNAFSAVEDGGRILVEASRGRRGTVVLAVSDNGCGIQQDDIKRVFEPFFSTRTRQGGTGLGLSITYGLVNELGGEITVDSVVGEGSIFTITFPIESQKGGGTHAGTPRR